MSRFTAMTILDQVIGRPTLILPQYAIWPQPEVASNVALHGMIAAIRALATVDMDEEQRLAERRRHELAATYFPGASMQQEKPFAFADGKAVIPVHGVLVNRLPYSLGYATGYNFIRSQVNAAMDDPDVDGIIYDVNSYGGLVSGCEETSDLIQQSNGANGGKPSMAVVDANCYSAAYMLASGADKLVSTPTGGVGSIGVVLMHADVSKALEDFGVKVSFIHAGKHKVDGNPFEPLSPEVSSDLQKEINKVYDRFVGTVARNRPGMSEQAARDTEARCYQADDALEAGLIDAVQSPPAAIRSFTSNQQEEPAMGTENKDKDKPVEQPQAQPAAVVEPTAEQLSAAQKTERERIRSIQSHPEAEGRTQLANHLALDTDMTVEAAAGILKASPKQAAAVPQAAAEPSHFKNAMNNGKHPNVGSNEEAGASEDEEGKPQSAAARILANQKRVTGYGGVKEPEKLRRAN